MEILYIIPILGVVLFLHDLSDNCCTHKNMMKKMRDRNRRRGITKRPGWKYR